jgi:hypothetical protein
MTRERRHHVIIPHRRRNVEHLAKEVGQLRDICFAENCSRLGGALQTISRELTP